LPADPIELVATGFNVALLRAALKDQSLWDRNKARTSDPRSPHYGCSDIWARYAPISEYGIEGPFKSVWYDELGETLLKPLGLLAYDILEMVGGYELGGVLVTRIPAGGEVKPHIDRGWHARHYADKFCLSVEANEEQTFCFESKQLVSKPGDLFFFDNSQLHWVTNKSTSDRVSVIFCTKR